MKSLPGPPFVLIFSKWIPYSLRLTRCSAFTKLLNPLKVNGEWCKLGLNPPNPSIFIRKICFVLAGQPFCRWIWNYVVYRVSHSLQNITKRWYDFLCACLYCLSACWLFQGHGCGSLQVFVANMWCLSWIRHGIRASIKHRNCSCHIFSEV